MIIKTIDLLVMIANKEKLPKKIKLLSREIKDEFRILKFNGVWYEYKDGIEWSIVPNYLHLNDEIEVMKGE